MFEQCLYFNTTSLARKLEKEWTRAFKPFGLTPSQAFMLRVILSRPAITGTELSLEMNVSKATCSRIVDGLVALGFVKKVQAGADARSYQLHPSEEARAARDAINQASAKVTKKIRTIIGSDHFESTVKSLRNIGSAIE